MTDTLLQDFGRDGYVCVNPLYGTAEMDALNREIARFVPTMPDSQVYYEDKADKSSLKQLQMMFEYDSYFGDLMENGSVRRIAETVLADEVVPINLAARTTNYCSPLFALAQGPNAKAFAPAANGAAI